MLIKLTAVDLEALNISILPYELGSIHTDETSRHVNATTKYSFVHLNRLAHTFRQQHAADTQRQSHDNPKISATIFYSRLGGVVVSVLATGSKGCGFKIRPRRWIFKGDKNPQHTFLSGGK
jgi:hypothetical protein